MPLAEGAMSSNRGEAATARPGSEDPRANADSPAAPSSCMKSRRDRGERNGEALIR
jgi:hypothetical protein